MIVQGTPSAVGGHRRVAVQTSALVVAAIAIVATGAAAFISLSESGPKPVMLSCDATLLAQIGGTGTGLCLTPLNVVESVSNLSNYYVPVLVMSPGSSASIDIMYNVAGGYYVSNSKLKPEITATRVPLALSVPSALVNKSAVGFSSGKVVFQNSAWVIYRYALNASAGSSGAYAILPPYYVGMYPALIVGTRQSFNTTQLALWGYSGFSESGEVILPSTVVGVRGLTVLNETVPVTTSCPNPACGLVSRSLY